MNTDPKTYAILCYGDSNTWGWVPGKMGAERFPASVRWPGTMQGLLGPSYEVIEAGFGGRSTAHDDPRPEMPLRNGLQTLPMVLETHSPLDAVILMLGTTDCKEMMGLTAQHIAEGMEALVNTVRQFKGINGQTVAEIIVAAPLIPNEKVGIGASLFAGGTAKGEALAGLYKEIASRCGCHFINVNDHVAADSEEGVHIGADDHRRLGAEMGRLVRHLSESR